MPRGFILHFTAAGAQAIDRQEFAGLPIRIGRNTLNDCKLPFNFISDFHARIDEIDGRISISDLHSKNGVFVRSQGTASRIPEGTPVELAAFDNEFFLGPSLRTVLEVVDNREWSPERAWSGTVLGNRAMLGMASGGEAPGAAELAPPASLPPLQGGLAAAPPWSPGSVAGAGQAAAAMPMDYAKDTQHFELSLETLALVGLTELAGSLLPDQPLRTQGDLARLITRLHDTIEVFCRCFIPLREGYSQFVSSMDLQQAASQRAHRSPGYHRVETARTPEEVACALLDFRDRSVDSTAAIEGIFADLMRHQLALLDGVMRGVRALLTELSPENIEQAIEPQRGPFALSVGRHKALWQEYCQRFDELSEEKQALLRIFGPEFARAYREYGSKRSSDRG
jgi:type VI secretion system protein ImpI